MNPLISVIITTRNEEVNIKSCLDSILSQNYPKDEIEIIVVDNNSSDKTKEVVEAIKQSTLQLYSPSEIASHPDESGISQGKLYNFQLLNRGPERSAQRNFGVEKSSGEYFIYLDADMTLSKNVISDCVNLVEVRPQINALYVSEIVTGEKFWSKVRRFERSFYDATVIDCVRFVKKEAFQKVGGFDENLTGPEDWDFDKKIRNLGRACPDDCENNLFGACPDDCGNNLFGVALIKTPIYHNEAEFNLKKYINKKGYYAQKFDEYIAKWGKNNPDIKKQFGIYYRFFGVFVENGRWKKMLAHPILTAGMYGLRLIVGVKFLKRNN
jgi:glycosyltransferase involved in cell wall biosynthesis